MCFSGKGRARVVTQFLGNLLRGEPIHLVDGGHQRRCFTYLDDSIDALMRILENSDGAADGQIFNIGNPNNDFSIAELAQNRSSDAEIARGLWWNSHTIVQHPTIHHWRKEQDLVECKKLFVQNYPGDPTLAEPIFLKGQGPIEMHDWVFDGEQKLYAPVEFWSTHKRQWIDQEVEITSAQR